MGTLIHKIEYLAGGTTIATAFWTGPVEGIIEIAKHNIAKKVADSARVIVEATGTEVWSECGVTRDDLRKSPKSGPLDS